MNSTLLLEDRKRSFLLIEERDRKDIVVGVPHHAPAGVPSLPCREHSIADENAGYIGLRLAMKLNCSSIIAGNYHIDSNKLRDSDYSRQIEKWNPKVFVEIHGHGGVNAEFDIEISSGSRGRERYSKALAAALSQRLQNNVPELQILRVSGDYQAIYFKASASVTINTDKRITYHIELPKSIRSPQAGELGPPGMKGELFVTQLADSLIALHG